MEKAVGFPQRRPKADYVEIPLAAEMTDDDIDRAIRMHEGGGEKRHFAEKKHTGKMGISWGKYWNIMGQFMEWY